MEGKRGIRSVLFSISLSFLFRSSCSRVSLVLYHSLSSRSNRPRNEELIMLRIHTAICIILSWLELWTVDGTQYPPPIGATWYNPFAHTHPLTYIVFSDNEMTSYYIKHTVQIQPLSLQSITKHDPFHWNETSKEDEAISWKCQRFRPYQTSTIATQVKSKRIQELRHAESITA